MRFRIRIDQKCWIRMRIRIRIVTNADPQHCLLVTRIPKDEHSLLRYRNWLFCALFKILYLVTFTQLLSYLSQAANTKISYFLFTDLKCCTGPPPCENCLRLLLYICATGFVEIFLCI
jgi:hypothetical protein